MGCESSYGKRNIIIVVLTMTTTTSVETYQPLEIVPPKYVLHNRKALSPFVLMHIHMICDNNKGRGLTVNGWI